MNESSGNPVDNNPGPITLIAGCGDVGCRLALLLMKSGHRVYGLRRDISQLPEGVLPIKGELTDDSLLGDWPEQIDYLIYCAAAGRQGEDGYRQTYLHGLENALNRLNTLESPPRRIFFTSSTAVYHQNEGEWVDELSPTRPEGFNGKVMLEAEALLVSSELPATVVRFGGIYGPGRNFMLNKVKGGEVYADTPRLYGNRIHSDDCAGMLAWLIKLDRAGVGIHPLYLGVDSDPAPLSEVTHWLAEEMGVVSTKEIPASGRGSKRCRNDRILESGYRFRYPGFRAGYQGLI
ncbi:SDR family oxidoreductase [Sansalvadorimonas sp. 2012CJ34-2]|uniref:SDR family oxidoreductase n=1 Tax=Parendozoicomonas callyspongiae TaxID=2942213 RepID=A0ABT0PEK3_9GAMM|nr:SDR family oxidoreductase [Sansalvadorimonas sp. 2012CJ34-2]MCL6269738.1 SDR family oxidoreductase [Sansalvadorimonas sp. 2012CJ34-2]